jgi:hypothetical protein
VAIPGLAELAADVRAQRRYGRVFVDVVGHLEPTRDPVALADQIVQSLALTPLGAAWRAVPADEARRIGRSVLASHLAYGSEIMPAAQADALVDRFLALVGEPRAFFTNTRAIGSSRTIAPITTATVDEGIVAVGHDRTGILWVADED